MAKTKVVDLSEGNLPPDPAVQELADLNDAEDGDLFRVIDELQSTEGIKLQITRVLPADRKGFCGDMSVSEFSLTSMRNLYGPGKYRVRVQGPKGYLPGGGPVNIAPDAERKTAPANDFTSFLEVMERRDAAKNEKFHQLLLLAIPAAGGIIQAMVGRQGGTDVPALIAALKPAPGPTMQDLTQTMVNLKALSGEKGSSDPIDTVLKIMERVKDLGGEEPKGGSNWLDIARDLIRVAPETAKNVLEGIQKTQQQQRQAVAVVQQPPVAPSALPPSATETSASVASKDSNTNENDMLQLFMPVIKIKLAQIATWATENKSPQIYASVFFDELPSNIAQFIPQDKAIEYLKHPEWFKYVCEQEPKLSAYQSWCDQFRLALLDIMDILENPEPDDDLPEPPGPTDHNDVTQSGT